MIVAQQTLKHKAGRLIAVLFTGVSYHIGAPSQGVKASDP